jgi:thioredoxin 1
MAEVNHCHSAEALAAAIQHTPGLVLVDFYAQWCGPCKAIAPKLDDLAKNYAEEGLTIFKVDVEEVSSAGETYGVQMMPTFLLFRGGEQVQKVVGADLNKLRRAVLDNIQ